MNNMATNEAASARDMQPGFPRDLADLIRHAARFGGRHGYRVAAPGASGHIYFDAGRAIHAEFGEDCGLRAGVELPSRGSGSVLELTSELALYPSTGIVPRPDPSPRRGEVRAVELPIEYPLELVSRCAPLQVVARGRHLASDSRVVSTRGWQLRP